MGEGERGYKEDKQLQKTYNKNFEKNNNKYEKKRKSHTQP